MYSNARHNNKDTALKKGIENKVQGKALKKTFSLPKPSLKFFKTKAGRTRRFQLFPPSLPLFLSHFLLSSPISCFFFLLFFLCFFHAGRGKIAL